MSPVQIWCNEAQERYVLAIAPETLGDVRAICKRERCPYAVVGPARADGRLVVEDPRFGNPPVDMPLEVILGNPPKNDAKSRTGRARPQPLDLRENRLSGSGARVLRFPAVADKTFLIAIGDRTVGGMTARDPMVGPWQVPVADVAVTLHGFQRHSAKRWRWASARRSR